MADDDNLKSSDSSGQPEVQFRAVPPLDDGVVGTKPIEVPMERVRETGAQNLAYGILAAFAGAVLLVLILGYVVVFLMVFKGSPVTDVEVVMTKSFLPLLEKSGTFASTVFGPLLAFVLGYYFGERRGRGSDKGP